MWTSLKAGELLQPVEKCQGLKKGDTVKKLGGLIRVDTVRREPLRMMTERPGYGRSECIREGFPHLSPEEFVAMFCKANKCGPEVEVTRIEFTYIEGAAS